MRRVAFRFGVVFAVLVMFPFPLGYLPGRSGSRCGCTSRFAGASTRSRTILGIPEPSTRMTGSGDTTFAYLEPMLFALAAIAFAIGWTAVDRSVR